jgi:hypothetical protein
MAVLIACSMLKLETESLFERYHIDIETVWMDKGLHTFPEKCRESLQMEIDRCRENETVLLAYSLCGNAVLGLKSGSRTLIIPKFDDCIRMLLSPPDRRGISISPRCLYFTEAWIDSDKYLFREFDGYITKYGDKTGSKVARKMIEGYKEACLVDTGVFDRGASKAILQKDAARWGLRYTERQGSKRVLEKLLLGEWDGEFCRIGPNRTVDYRDFEDRTRCIDPDGRSADDE